MPWFALVSALARETVKIYPTRAAAEEALEEVLADEPDFVDILSVEAIELPESSLN